MISNSTDSLSKRVRRIVIASDDEDGIEPSPESSFNNIKSSSHFNDEEAEFTEGESQHGLAGNDIRSCMHLYSSSPPSIPRKSNPRSSLDKSAEIMKNERSKRESAIVAKQKFKELFADNKYAGYFDEDVEDDFVSPSKLSDRNNQKAKHSTDLLTSSEVMSTASNKTPTSADVENRRTSERRSAMLKKISSKRGAVLQELQTRFKSGLEVSFSLLPKVDCLQILLLLVRSLIFSF